MITRIVLVVTALALSTSMPLAASTGKGQPSENANALGVERATRNSDGGDREHGGFGPAQSDYVHTINESGGNYGQWLQGWKEANN